MKACDSDERRYPTVRSLAPHAHVELASLICVHPEQPSLPLLVSNVLWIVWGTRAAACALQIFLDV